MNLESFEFNIVQNLITLLLQILYKYDYYKLSLYYQKLSFKHIPDKKGRVSK